MWSNILFCPTPPAAPNWWSARAPSTPKYTDYIHLGVIGGARRMPNMKKMGKKAILFVMTDDTRNCDDVAEYLEGHYPDLKDAVLVIHTKSNGEISESTSGRARKSWISCASKPTRLTT